MQYLFHIVLLLISVFPKISWAQSSTPSFRSLVNDVTALLRGLIPILAAVALLVFFGGLAQYIFQSGDQSSVATGKNRMIAGVVGLFVISAIWGLVALISNTLDLGITVL